MTRRESSEYLLMPMSKRTNKHRKNPLKESFDAWPENAKYLEAKKRAGVAKVHVINAALTLHRSIGK